MQINASKSFCYLANVPADQSEAILSCLGFQLGTFPAKFLGVPLITSKLSRADCQPLLARIKSKISSWTNKFLSYVGRLQLLKSVIFAIQSYWSEHFALPAAVLSEIQSSLFRFLWKGPSLQKHGAKVACNKISLPLSEGGLAIKHIKDWNHALLILQVLKVINPFPPPYGLFGLELFTWKINIFGAPMCPPDCSWVWRKVLQLRPVALQYIRYQIGNGALTSLWFDPWLAGNPLASSMHSLLISRSRLGHNAKVSSIILNSAWNLPSSNHRVNSDFRRSFDYSIPCNPAVLDLIDCMGKHKHK